MEREYLPLTTALVDYIWNAYDSFIGQPGLIRRVEFFNKDLVSRFNGVFDLNNKPLVSGKNKPLLTAHQYKIERDKGLDNLEIAAKHRVTSQDQIIAFARAYDSFKKRESSGLSLVSG